MWEIKRNDILPQLDILSMVPDKLGIPSSAYIRVRGKSTKIFLSSASYIGGEVTLRGKGEWPFDEDFYLDRRLFMPFVTAARELKDKHTFQFEKHGKQLIVRHGSRKVAFDSQPNVKGYGNAYRILKKVDNLIPVSSELIDMLVCGKNCAISDSVEPQLDCVYLAKSSNGIAVRLYAASDKVSYLGVGKVREGKVTASIPFPLYLIDLLQNKGLKKILCCGKYVVLQFEHGLLWQPVSQEAVKDFPLDKMQKHIKRSKQAKITFVASSRRFARVIVRLGYYLQGIKRQDWVVKINGKKSAKVIDVNTSIAGAKFNEKISTSDNVPKDFKMEWPLDILEPIFMYLHKKTRKLGVIVRVDEAHGVSYVTVGKYWLAISSKQED